MRNGAEEERIGEIGSFYHLFHSYTIKTGAERGKL
jgi:hypothetical protein